MVWHGDICDKLVFSQKERNMQRWGKESEDVGSRTIQYFLTPDPSLDPFKWEFYGLSCLPHKAFMLINGKVTYNRRVLLPCWSLRHSALETYIMRYFNSSWWICFVFHYSRFNDLLLGEIHSKGSIVVQVIILSSQWNWNFLKGKDCVSFTLVNKCTKHCVRRKQDYTSLSACS